MQQHPVPQHIASYEFRLVGDMTIKQFGFLGGSCLVALFFYALDLPDYFKWPLVLFFILLGVGLAFFPIEERPLHRWLIAFFKAVYSPTQFIWKKQPQKLALFETSTQKTKIVPGGEKIPVSDQKQMSQYLQTLPSEKSPLEKKEDVFLDKVAHLFQATPTPVEEPAKEPSPVSDAPIASSSTIKITPSPTPGTVSKATPKAETEEEKAPPVTSGVTRITPRMVVSPVVEASPPPSTSPAPTFKPPEPVKEKPVVGKPMRGTIKIQPPTRPKQPTVEAKVSLGLPIPQTPKTPNLLVGMVLDQAGKMVEGAIIEIRNSRGVPMRALKTNKLGQFRIVTPLENDIYEIETEKEGYHFDIIKVELTGGPVLPLEIRTKQKPV